MVKTRAKKLIEIAEQRAQSRGNGGSIVGYTPEIHTSNGADMTCPFCFVDGRGTAILKPVASKDEYDSFRCSNDTCTFDIDLFP